MKLLIIKLKFYDEIIKAVPMHFIGSYAIVQMTICRKMKSYDMLTINWSPTKCQMTIVQNVIITTPGLSAGRVAWCAVPLANLRSSISSVLSVIAHP